MIFNMVSGGGVTIVTIPTVTVDNYTYNGSAQGPTISEYDPNQIVVTNATKVDAGTYTLTLALKNTSKMVWNDLTTADKTYEYTIGKAHITNASVSIAGYTYAGTKSTPSIVGNTSGGAVTYYGRATSGGTSTIWDSVTGTTYDAGTRYCYAVIAATNNYYAYTTGETSFAIAKASFSGATVSIAGYTYAGTKSTPTISGNVSGGSVTYYGRATATGTGTIWSSVTNTTYDAGTRYCYAVIAETTNYNASTTANTSFTIAKASFTSTVSIAGYTYAGTKSTPTVNNNPGNGTVTFYGRATSSGTATAWSSVTNKTYNAGTRYCYAVIAETTNYSSCTTQNTSFTIAQATPTLTLSKTSMTLNSSTLSDTATVTYDGDGTVSVGTSAAGVASASYSNGTVTVSSVDNTTGTATITVSASAGTNYLAASKTIAVTCAFVTIYGVQWDGTSSTVWSRTDAAQNFTDPVPAVNNGNGSSPFDNCMPWSGMKRVTDSTAGTLVEIPKFWYKWTISGSTMKLQIADAAADGFSVSPAHADRGDGKGERDVIYVGAYHCASTYKSTTGVTPVASITRATARTNIHNLGSTYWQYDYSTHVTIWMLYLVEYADWNSQTKIGYGCGNNSSAENSGLCDAMTYHTGTNAANRTTYGHTRYRYIEDLWGNVYDWCDGIYFSGSTVYAIKNPSSFSDSSDGTNVGTRPTSSGYISKWAKSSASGYDWFIYPSAVSGSNSTYTPDYCYYNSSGVVLDVGGYYNRSLHHGLFYLNGYSSASNAGAVIGCRLLKLP